MRRAAAFTFIEMLIVVAIVTMLIGMVMPVLQLAQRAAKRSATLSVMHKVDTALRLFKSEIGSYPWQREYADIAAGEPWGNRLHHQLGDRLQAGDVQNLQADAATAAAAYAFDCTGPGGALRESAAISTHAFRCSDVQPIWRYDTVRRTWVPVTDPSENPHRSLAFATVLNRMAQERARLAIFAGDVDVGGVITRDRLKPDGTLYLAGRDDSGAKLVASPRSAANPGWADDYLRGELEARYRDGDAILDAYGKPLIYVARITEGTRSVRSFLYGSGVGRFDVAQYGLERLGRKPLLAIDPLTEQPLRADPPALPDPTNLRHSDRRAYAAPGYENDFELWSAGPDRRFAWMRDEDGNQDNIPLLPYDKALR